jgi:hypothetical protein
VEAGGKPEEMRRRSDDGDEEEHNVMTKMKNVSRDQSRDRVTQEKSNCKESKS